MAITGDDKAILVARFGAMRFGATRFAYVPPDATSPFDPYQTEEGSSATWTEDTYPSSGE